MFCSKCGKGNKDSSKFCQHCGAQIVQPSRNGSAPEVNSHVRFYSKEWLRTWGVAIVPRMDILIDEKNLSVIKFPPSYLGTVCALVGLVFSIIGLLIGAMIGSYIDKQRRERLRLTWVNAEGNVTSAEYKNHIYFSIPLADLKERLELKGGKAIRIEHGGKKFVLKTSKKERERFENYLKEQAHVL